MKNQDRKQKVTYAPIPISLIWSKPRSAANRQLLVILLTSVLLAIALLLAEIVWNWSTRVVEVAGIRMFVIIAPQLMVMTVLTLWFGFWWGVLASVPVNIALALLSGMSLPWALVLLIAPLPGLALIALAYRAVPMSMGLRSFTALLFYFVVVFTSQVATSTAVFIWPFALDLGDIDLFALWQGWWTTGTLSRFVFTAPLLYWVSPHVAAWKSRRQLGAFWQRPPRSHVVFALGLLLIVVALFKGTGSFLSISNLDIALNPIEDEGLLEAIYAPVRHLNQIRWVDYAMLISMAFFVYQIWVKWTETLERTVAEQTQKVRAALREKEVLLKEIHHRVKNNMAVISSLLNMQSRLAKNRQAVDVLHESRNRVESMVLIHERLYKSEDFSKVHFAEYIKGLATQLFRTYSVQPNLIKMNIRVDDIQLTIDIAVPCGLILNELISNSLKHAFPNQRKGEITVELHANHNSKSKKSTQTYLLIVSDNGVGLPDELNMLDPESLGLRLVNTLANQIQASIELGKNEGTQFKINFKA